ncbi:MAG: hypothetical protein JST38_13610 [Bacteroidetes bacterium]|nr:hypothetical protein [Bacteroidota bacterium]MBS1941905.1 hypothetical protein [Bacteroidota bacterium]
MKTLKHIGVFIGMFALVNCSSAQTSALADTLYFRDGHSMAVQLDEIGPDALIYRQVGETLRRSVAKSEIARITLHSGEMIKIALEPMDAKMPPQAAKLKHVLKVDILSPVTNHLVLGYEQVLRPWMNVEAKVGLIGVGIAKQEDAKYSGVMLKAGIKFITRPTIASHGMKLNALLQGGYVKPELIYSSYTMKSTGLNGSATLDQDPVKSGDFAFNLVLGKQHLLGGAVTVDTFFGLGFGMHWSRTSDEVDKDAGSSKLFGVMVGRSSFPIALSAGMTFGVAF